MKITYYYCKLVYNYHFSQDLTENASDSHHLPVVHTLTPEIDNFIGKKSWIRKKLGKLFDYQLFLVSAFARSPPQQHIYEINANLVVKLFNHRMTSIHLKVYLMGPANVIIEYKFTNPFISNIYYNAMVLPISPKCFKSHQNVYTKSNIIDLMFAKIFIYSFNEEVIIIEIQLINLARSVFLYNFQNV